MAKRKVLIVEDVPELSHLLGMTIELDDRFVPAASARNADEAISLAEQHQPDAVVLDVSIDGVETGIDVLPRLRELLPEARIIVFTAHGNQQQQERALSRGASGYIVKGGDLQPLLDALDVR
jgi:two-component system nitrate/nitrite response regulator NarL